MTVSSARAPMVDPRIWPALVIVTIAILLRFVPGWVAPMTLVHFIGLAGGPMIGLLGLLIWWPLARRIPLRDRMVGLAIGIATLVVFFSSAHPSMRQFLVTHALVSMLLAFGLALALTRATPWPRRRLVLALVFVLTLLPWNVFRQDGQMGDLAPKLTARWTPTAEDIFLDGRSTAQATKPDTPVVETRTADWPGYRGPLRDGRAAGSFDTDWESRAPRELWRRRVGPGWSSFAVAGDRIFTQEQRGDEEVVVCYALQDGAEIWAEGTPERFEEPASGTGPRATPTFDRGRLFTLGANGTVQSFDAATGSRYWRRNLQEDVAAPLPPWGFSSSPVVVGNAVVVFAGSDGGQSVVAYDRESGDLLWSAGEGGHSYSSGHRATIGDVEQILMASDVGLQSLDPANGDLLWEHRWPTLQMPRIVQPVLLEGRDSLVLGTGYGFGSRRLNVDRDPSGAWTVEQQWSSKFLKPYFNDLVCHRGHCYGFDGRIFTCIGVDDGERRWKGGRYGHGQVLLLPEMDLLLVLTEQGEVVLVEATPDEHRELGRFEALSGKTWNHPVVTQGRLLVRNAEEAACFELAAGSAS